MIESKVVTIDGDEYEITHLNPKESVRTLARVLKLIAFPMMRGVDMDIADKKKDIGDAEISFEKIADGLSKSVDEDSMITIIESLLKGVRVRKSGGFVPASMEVDFAGKMSALFGVVKEALIHNYADMLKKNLPAAVAARL